MMKWFAFALSLLVGSFSLSGSTSAKSALEVINELKQESENEELLKQYANDLGIRQSSKWDVVWLDFVKRVQKNPELEVLIKELGENGHSIFPVTEFRIGFKGEKGFVYLDVRFSDACLIQWLRNQTLGSCH